VNRLTTVICWLLVAFALAACGPPGRSADPSSNSEPGQAARAKRLVWILNLEPEGFSELFGGSSSTHWRMVYEALHDFLVVLDNNGEPIERLATGRPTRENGGWQIGPDGTMETTWRLRPNARWQNGEPLRAADFVLGWRVARDPGVPFNKRAVATLIDRIDTSDDNTLVFHWTGPYAYADRIQPFDLDPFPTWNASLVDAFENRKSELSGHPWFSREFVGLGPYRLGSWAPGSYLTLEANSDWYGGRPKIDSIEARFILDPNARLAAMLSGDGQFLHTTDLDQRRTFQQQAVASGRGELIQHTVGRMQLAVVKQANPIFGGPDRARQRQAMLYALDRESLAEIQTGERSNVADSWLFKGSPKYDALRGKIVAYPYNPTEALRLLGEIGWTRGADGVLRDATG